MTHLLGNGLWSDTALVLAVGVAFFIGLAALAEHSLRSAIWQRTCWQVALVGVGLLGLAETTGIAPALAHLGCHCFARHMGQAVAAADATRASNTVESAGGLARSADGPARQSRTTVVEQGATVVAWETLPWVGGQARGPDAPPPRLGLRYAQPPATDVQSPAVDDNANSAGKASLGGGLAGRAVQPEGDIQTLALGLWGLGTLVLTVRLLWVRVMLLVFAQRQPGVHDAPLCRRVEAMAGRLGIRRPVRLRQSRRVATPVVVGCLPATLILPDGFTAELDPRQQDAILAHELAHVAAWDPTWHLAADAVCSVLWWHPLMWWLRRRLRAVSESAADEASLLVPDGPDLLAACLVDLGWRLARPRRLGWVAMAGPGFRSGLGRRVERLLGLAGQPWPPPRRPLTLARLVLPLVLVGMVVFGSAWARPQVVLGNGGTTMGVLAESWRHSLAAAMLVALWAPAVANAPADEPAKPAAVKEGPQEKERPAAREERREMGPEDREALVRKLMERVEQIKRELRELRPEQKELAEKLHRELREIGGRLRELGGPRAGAVPERERVMRRLEELKEAMGRAREAGRRDEVERLEREAHELMQAVRGGREGPGREGPPREEVERRLRHLKEAVENLREGGFPELAERLQREAEGMMRRAEGRPETPPPRREGREGPPPELERVVRELRGDVERLRQQMEEMREHLKRLMEQRAEKR